MYFLIKVIFSSAAPQMRSCELNDLIIMFPSWHLLAKPVVMQTIYGSV